MFKLKFLPLVEILIYIYIIIKYKLIINILLGDDIFEKNLCVGYKYFIG